MNVKNNNQYLTTHKRIEECVLVLLRDKQIQEIAITEICDALSINRSTFYAHFRNVMDVLLQAEADEMEKLKAVFRRGLLISRREAFIAIFRYIARHREFYTIYFGQSKEINFADNAVFDRGAEARRMSGGRLEFTDEEIEYFICFFRSGVNAMIKKWLNEGARISPEKLFEIIRKQFEMGR